MIDYSQWQRTKVKVTNIRLDSENPRIPPGMRSPSQQELIQVFTERYRILELTKSIADDGYFPDERIVVIKTHRSNYTTLEGNRRVAALKLLLNPDIAPSNLVQKFRSLSSTVQNPITEVEVVIASSRQDATKLILEKHTQPSVFGWSPIMQAEFYGRLVDQGNSPAEIASSFNIQKGEIDRSLRMRTMYHLSASLEYPEKIKKAVLDFEDFNISALQRVYESLDGRSYLTLSSDLNTFSCDEDLFRKAFSKIVTDIARKKEDTRTLHKQKDVQRYVRQLRDEINIKNTGKAVSVKKIIDASAFVRQAGEDKEKKPRSTRKTKSLFLKSAVPFHIKGAASLRCFYEELQKIPVKTYPNSTAILLRVFIDKACRHYLGRKKITQILSSGKMVNLDDATLGDLLDFLQNKKNTLLRDNIKKAIRTFKSSSTFASLSSLNTIVHNEQVVFIEEHVRNLWPNVEGLLVILLEE